MAICGYITIVEIDMKSNKQRRLEIKTKRRKRNKAKKLEPFGLNSFLQLALIEAGREQLLHNNTYSFLPKFYLDKPFSCKDCGTKEIWTAIKQKWWYEVAKGHIDSTAVRCMKCRMKKRREKEQHKQHMAEVAKREPHPNEAFFKKIY